MSQDKVKIAREAAIAYYGLSSAEDGFPKGTQIKIFDEFGMDSQTLEYVKRNIAKKVEAAWNDCIGTLSRTARMSSLDFASMLGMKNRIDWKKVENWMKCITDLYEDVLFVEVAKDGDRKLLLVNTKISM